MARCVGCKKIMWPWQKVLRRHGVHDACLFWKGDAPVLAEDCPTHLGFRPGAILRYDPARGIYEELDKQKEKNK